MSESGGGEGKKSTKERHRGEQKKLESTLNHDIKQTRRDTYQSLKLEKKRYSLPVE